MITLPRAIIYAALSCAALSLIGDGLVRLAGAHSDGGMSYPMECCSAVDCAPIEHADSSALYEAGNALVPSVLTITTRHGTAVVPANFPRRDSKDGRSHACMRSDGNGGMRLVCYFVAPQG